MLVLLLTLVMASEPQQSSAELTRAEELQLARETKAQELRAPKRSFLERGLYEIRERQILERFRAGLFNFHPLVGGMHSGAGFALGTSYAKGIFDASAQASFKGYQRYEARLSAPPALGDRLFASVRAEYRNYSEETFFGVGNDSSEDDRAHYRMEDRTFAGEFGLRMGSRAKAGVSLGWIETNISDGERAGVRPISDTSYVTSLSAFDSQPHYLKTGAFFTIDSRDEPGNPRAGSRISAEWSSYHDQNLGEYGFDRMDIEVQHYLPFLNGRRVIALRARTALTHTADGQEVPFYMLPSLGGADDLRGFSEFRFRDKQMAVLNAEYRWEAFSGLDMALFADAGQVASSLSEFDLGDMKTAAGIGFRFNTAKKVFCRVDVGFSQEGPRVFLNFGHVF